MKLEDFLCLIQDEEARIELEIDDDEQFRDGYLYTHFWLSDFRTSDDTAKYYKDYSVSSFSFEPEIEGDAQIMIQIKY